MQEYIIGVDLGTTSTKSVLYDLKGQVISSANVGYEMYQDTPDMSEEDPEEIFAAVTETITEVIRKANAAPEEIKGVSFSSAMHSLILMDENDRPMTRVITWADNRAKDQAAALKESPLGMEIYRATGTPIHPMSPLAKMLWLKEDHPDLYQKTKKFIGIKEYILFKLFGEYKEDYSIANATGLFNIHEMDWNQQSLDLVEVTASQLPDLVDTTYQMRGIDKSYAKVMGLSPDTPFILGASDGALSNLGVNAIDQGVLAITIGTSGAVRTMMDEPTLEEKGRLFCYYLTEGHWVVGGPVNNGGIIFKWVRDQLFDSEKSTAKQLNMNSYDLLTDIASKVPAGADGLLFHPYLGGERAPIWNADARGSLFGLNRNHTRAHILRAVLEGIVYNLYMVMLTIEGVGGRPKSIQATGGFAESQLWRQMLADIFEQDVSIPESFESSCLGAAVVGMLSLGIIDDIGVVKDMVGTSVTHHPIEENYANYRELIPIWLRLIREYEAEYQPLANYQASHIKAKKGDL